MNYSKHFSTTNVPTSQPIPDAAQIQNSDGHYVYQADMWTQFNRFLILGCEGGSYYASEKKLTVDNAQNVMKCIDADGARAVQRIIEVSDKGLSAKNDPAIFALAMAAGAKSDQTRQLALNALPLVCRTGTHLFHFAEFVKAFRGWGRGLTTAIAKWYNRENLSEIAYQCAKYQNRDGWTHRDLLRKSHPVPLTDGHNALFNWAVKGELKNDVVGLEIIQAMEKAKKVTSEKEIVDLITDSNLPRECIPNTWLDKPSVWNALLQHMPLTATIRNLSNMTKCGLISAGSDASKLVAKRLKDAEYIKKSRVHPIAILSALKTYESGKGVRGSSTWTPVGKVVDALDDAFYLSFDNVEPTGKRWMLALDVSGSMTWSNIAGVPGLTPRVASSAMAMVIARTEEDYVIGAFSHGISILDISPKQRLDDVMRRVDGLDFGSTDCSLPMVWARKEKKDFDVFAVYTDSETNCNKIHPSLALQQYRKARNIPAKLIVVATEATEFSIADPKDTGMMDVVGFSTDTPSVMNSFVRGEI